MVEENFLRILVDLRLELRELQQMAIAMDDGPVKTRLTRRVSNLAQVINRLEYWMFQPI